MRFMFRSKTTTDDPSMGLGVLVLATGLVLTLQNPNAVDSASRLLSELDLPSPARVLEVASGQPPALGRWRPDADAKRWKTTPAVTAVSRNPEPGLDPRERPLR
jgi:hypothetical protein